MTKIRVKSIPVPSWCNTEGAKIITAFNNQRKSLYLDMYAEHLKTVGDLEAELEQGMYDFVYPTCKEAERLKDLVEDSANYARYLGFSFNDLDVEQGAVIVTRCSSDMVRDMCISHGYYTKGTNEDYTKLLSSIYNRNFVSGDYLLNIAKDIKFHSNTSDTVIEISQNILDKACTTFISEYLEF